MKYTYSDWNHKQGTVPVQWKTNDYEDLPWYENPDTVIVDDVQTGLIENLRSHGFQIITTSMRQSRTLGGGLHCVTNDLERE